MDIHPWTKYEVARLRDEERLLRARSAMRAKEVGRQSSVESTAARTPSTRSWFMRLRGSEARAASAESSAA